jgi:phenylacetate-CoA ligase
MNELRDLEKQPADAIREFQFQQVLETLATVKRASPFYKRLFSLHSINTDSFRNWKHFESIPPTTKDDIQQFNWDFLCVPRKELVEYTSTSGTLGKPVTIALTAKDVRRLAYNECRSFECADGNASDLYQLLLTMDRQFMAGLAYYEGIRRLGAGMVRAGAGFPSMQFEIMQRLRPTALVAVPSFLLKLVDYAQANAIDLQKLSVKKAICIGEPIRLEDLTLNAIGRKIAASWDIKLFGTYAATEMQTAFTECYRGKGGHLIPDLLYVEILDHNNQPVTPGESGEVVITTFGVEGMPLVRYKTGDKASLLEAACACGRTTSRIGPIVGRLQNMVKLKGTTLYPPAIVEPIHGIQEINNYTIEIYWDEFKNDQIRIWLSAATDAQQRIRERLTAGFQSTIKVTPEIVFIPQAEIEIMQGVGGASRKIKKILDRRL